MSRSGDFAPRLVASGVDLTEPQAIADALCGLMTDKLEAEAIGRQAQERVQSRYCWESEAEKLLGLYEQTARLGCAGLR